MLEIRLCNTALRLDFSFFAVMALFFFFDNRGTGTSALCACLCHELGHLILITGFGAPVSSITLYGAGIRISAQLSQLTLRRKTAVLAAGCAVNLVLCLVSYLCGNILFSAVNAVLCIFNLLPLGELDGAQLMKLAAERHLPPRQSDLLTSAARVCAVMLCAAAMLLAGGAGISFILTCTYLLLMMAKNP